MPAIKESQFRELVKRYLVENNLIKEDEEMTDELTKIITKLGIGKNVNKSVLAAAMKAGSGGRNAKQNAVIAELFMSILDQPDMIMKIVPLLKQAAAESDATE